MLQFDKPCVVAIDKSWVPPAFLQYQLNLVFLENDTQSVVNWEKNGMPVLLLWPHAPCIVDEGVLFYLSTFLPTNQLMFVSYVKSTEGVQVAFSSCLISGLPSVASNENPGQ